MMNGFVSRWWVACTVMVVLAGSGAYIGALRLREVPDRAVGVSEPAMVAAAPNTRTVLYRLAGRPGAAAQVSFLAPGEAVQTERVTLPWRREVRVAGLTASVGVVAQAADGRLLCEIAVDGEIRATQASTRPSPVVNCSLPAA